MFQKNGYGFVDSYDKWRKTRLERPPVPFLNDQISLPAGVLKVGNFLGFTHAQGPPNAYTVILLKDGGVEVKSPGIYKLIGSPGDYTCYFVDSSERQDSRAVIVKSREGYQLTVSLSYSFKVIHPEKVIFTRSLERLWVAIDTSVKEIARNRSHDDLSPVGAKTEDFSALSSLIFQNASGYPINQWIEITELTVTDVAGDPDRTQTFLSADMKATEIAQERGYVLDERDLELTRMETEWMLQNERDELRKVVADRDVEIFETKLQSRIQENQLSSMENYPALAQSIIEKSLETAQGAWGAQDGFQNGYGIPQGTMQEILSFAERALPLPKNLNFSYPNGDGTDPGEDGTGSSKKRKRDIYAEVKELQEETWSFDVRVTKRNGENFNVVVALPNYQVKLVYDGNNPQVLLSGMTKKGDHKRSLPQDLIAKGSEQSIQEFLQLVALYLISTYQAEFAAAPGAKSSGPNGSDGSGVSSEGEAKAKERPNE